MRSTQHAALLVRLVSSVLVLIAAAQPACSARAADPPLRGSVEEVRGGSVDSNGAFQAVAQVNVVGRGNCSGTLVTPLLVLTANHCVTGTSRDGFDCAGATGIATLADLTVGATVNFFVSGNGFYPGQPSLTSTQLAGSWIKVLAAHAIRPLRDRVGGPPAGGRWCGWGPTWYVASVSLSDTKLVWIVVEGPEYPSKYTFVTARLYWSPVATDPSGLTVTEGPLLSPATGAFYNTRTGGDFAASQGCYETAPNEGACPIFVVQLSTGKLWKIPPRPASGYQEVMAVSQSTILVSESDWPGTPSEGQHIRRFVRFSTGDLDALETAW